MRVNCIGRPPMQLTEFFTFYDLFGLLEEMLCMTQVDFR
jgi:hypothetical protein